MENITRSYNPVNYKITFDLKGSSFKRETKLDRKFWNQKLDQPGVLKDLNFILISKALGSKLINISEERCSQLIATLEADT